MSACRGATAQGLLHYVDSVCFENQLDLSCEEAQIIVVDGPGYKEFELLLQAFFEQILSVVKRLFNLDELGDGLEICDAVSSVHPVLGLTSRGLPGSGTSTSPGNKRRQIPSHVQISSGACLAASILTTSSDIPSSGSLESDRFTSHI